MLLKKYFFVFNLSIFFVSFFFIAFSFGNNPIKITKEDDFVDISQSLKIYLNQGKFFRVSTVPDTNGIIRKIEIHSNGKDTIENWGVFSLSNLTNQKIEKIIVSPHYQLFNSRILSPNLSFNHIKSIIPSDGLTLRRRPSLDSDIFYLTINPNTTVTFVAELGKNKISKLYLWDLESYIENINFRNKCYGFLIGIISAISIFWTFFLFFKRYSPFLDVMIFSWSVFFYTLINSYFCNNFFYFYFVNFIPGIRAFSEAFLVGSILNFLCKYLYFRPRDLKTQLISISWIFILIIIAIFFPIYCSSIARISLFLISIFGLGIILYFFFHGCSRASMIIPVWILIVFWTIIFYITSIGYIDKYFVQYFLSGSLIIVALIISLISIKDIFSRRKIKNGLYSEEHQNDLAIIGSENFVWNLDILNDRISTYPDISLYLGISSKQINGSIKSWISAIHIEDSDIFQIKINSILKHSHKKLFSTFRLQSGDGQYIWFELRARSMTNEDGKIISCIGIMVDITTTKKTEEYLFKSSIYDSLTGLSSKELLLDRIQNYCNFSYIYKSIKPTILVMDFDNFKVINQYYGFSIGNIFLITIAKRLTNYLNPLDTVCRLFADRFSCILISENKLLKISSLILEIKKIMSLPIEFSNRKINLPVSIGILPWIENDIRSPLDRLNDATLAMYYAKHNGGNRIEPFQKFFSDKNTKNIFFEEELKKSFLKKEIFVVYNPIFDVRNNSIVGFSTYLNWNNPIFKSIFFGDFISNIESSSLILKIINYMISQISRDIKIISEIFLGKEFFISINIPKIQNLHQEFINKLHLSMIRIPLKKNNIQIEVSTEDFVRNPKFTLSLCENIKNVGFGLVLKNFDIENESLNFLTRFPFNMIKFNYSLFQNKKPYQIIFLRSLINLFENLNLKIVVDGVNSKIIDELLGNIKCKFLEKKILGNSMKIDSLIHLIKNHKR